MKFAFLIIYSFLFISTSAFSNVVLLNFDDVKKESPFEVNKSASGSNQGRVEAYKYYNFDLEAFKFKNWSDYQFLEIDFYNPNDDGVQVFVTLADKESFDYWSQVNYVQTLVKGWNRLSLPLDQLVGERGSVKYNRKLNLNTLNKFFVVIDPDKKTKLKSKEFFIDNIVLKKAVKVNKSKDIYSFDFTDKIRGNSVETEVLSSDLYQFENNPSKFYGFSNANFFRSEDSMYAPTGLRGAIGVLGGDFKVRLPNGNYEGHIIIDHLGYWDVPFFRDRTVFIQGKPIFKETRNNSSEFINDLLRFENLDITPKIDVYNSTIDRVFKKIPFSASVVNEELVFSFSGDATGVMLNRLVFYPKNKANEGEVFVKELEKKDRQEYSQLMRSLVKKPNYPNAISVKLIEPDGSLDVSKIYKEENAYKSLLFQKESKIYFFEIVNGSRTDIKLKYNYEIKNLVNGDLVKISDVNTYILKNQFISPDLNHETFTIGARIFEENKSRNISVDSLSKKVLAIKIPDGHSIPIGEFEIKIGFSGEKINKELIIPFRVLNDSLPTVDFPVGFMGMDALPVSYFFDDNYEQQRFNYRKQIINHLAKAGFTLTTGLPDVKVNYVNQKFKYDSTILEKTLNEIKKYPHLKYVLSYGGEFPKRILEMQYLPQDMSQESYHKVHAEFIKKTLDRYPEINFIYTYSDEAHGYGNRIDADIYKGKEYKKFYPFLKLGGFTTIGKGNLEELNNLFDWPFFSDTNFKEIKKAKSNKVILGLYNSSQNTMDDPRFTFGVGLFMARNSGVSSYVEWSSVGFHNYPYFDLDGRESDVVLFYPRKDGGINMTLRLALAVEGLNMFRKLVYLDSLLNSPQAIQKYPKLKDKFQLFKQKYYFFKEPRFLSQKGHNFRLIDQEISQMLSEVYK